MKLPRLKFCGFTRAEDVASAIEMRVDAIGLNFYPHSKRYVEPRVAKEFSDLACGVCMRVGVFVDATPEEIDRVVSVCALDAIQLHGQESAQWLEEYENSRYWPGLPILRALPYRGPIDDAPWRSWVANYLRPHSSLMGLLVDAYDPIHKGGTGKRVNWGLLRPRPQSMLIDGDRSIGLLLAGGLNPENISEALEMVDPAGVDLASGIEVSPGVKDVAKMAQVVRAVGLYYASR